MLLSIVIKRQKAEESMGTLFFLANLKKRLMNVTTTTKVKGPCYITVTDKIKSINGTGKRKLKIIQFEQVFFHVSLGTKLTYIGTPQWSHLVLRSLDSKPTNRFFLQINFRKTNFLLGCIFLNQIV